MKVMISMPMNGKTDAQIKEDWIKYRNSIKKRNNEAEFIYTIFDEAFIPEEIKNISTYLLGLSIEKLAEADILYMAKGWKNARGCVIEHEIAKKYNIEIDETTLSRSPEIKMPKNMLELLQEIEKGNIDKLPDMIEVDGDPFEKRKSKNGKLDYYGVGEKKSLTEIFSKYFFIEDWLKLDVREW